MKVTWNMHLCIQSFIPESQKMLINKSTVLSFQNTEMGITLVNHLWRKNLIILSVITRLLLPTLFNSDYLTIKSILSNLVKLLNIYTISRLIFSFVHLKGDFDHSIFSFVHSIFSRTRDWLILFVSLLVIEIKKWAWEPINWIISLHLYKCILQSKWLLI